MSEKTCSGCTWFAPEPSVFSTTGACLKSYEMRRERNCEYVFSYKAVREQHTACELFEQKEDER